MADGVDAINDRLVYALRQAVFIGAALLIAGFVTERLRPTGGFDRALTSTPYLWTIVVWAAVLLLQAVAFEKSQMRQLEGMPLYGGVVVGAAFFVLGMTNFSNGEFGERLLYVFANTLGVVMFWWGLFSLGALFHLKLTDRQGEAVSLDG